MTARRPRATLYLPDTPTPVSLDHMHDLADVYMGAIHHSFDGHLIDDRALVGSLVASALGILRDMDIPNPRACCVRTLTPSI